MKGQSLKLLVVVTVCLSIAASCAAPSAPAPTPVPPTATPIPTPMPGPLDLMRSFETAMADGDLDAALALFSETPAFIWGLATATKQEELRGMLGWYIGMNTRPLMKDCRAEVATVTCTIVDRSDCAIASGVSGANWSPAVFNIENGKIRGGSAGQPVGEEWDTYYKWQDGFFPWAWEKHPVEMGKVFDVNSRLIWTQEAGAILSELCKEYGAGQK